METLVIPQPGSGEPIRNSSGVARYLNDSTIIFPHVSFGFYRSVPNLLTGIGILGTFLGLAAGVGSASSGMSSGNPDQIIRSLRDLLGGASLAFWTSIAGVSLSVAFLSVERIVSRRLHLKLNEWVERIESCLQRVTLEDIGLRQLEQARRSRLQLEKFNTELIFALEQALEEKIANRLSPQLTLLIESVNGLREDRSTDADRMLEQALERLTESMKEQTESQFKEMGDVVTNLNRTLKDSTAGLAQTQRDVRTVLDAILEGVKASMDASSTAMTETLQRSLDDVALVITDASGKLAEQLTTSSTAVSHELQTTMGSATQAMSAVISDLNRTLKDSTAGLAQTQRDVHTALDAVLAGVKTSMTAGSAAMAETLQQSLDNVTSVIAEASGKMAEQLTSASAATSQELQTTMGSVTDKLSRAGIKAASQISAPLQSLRASTKSLERSTTQSEQMLSNMTIVLQEINSLRHTIKSAQEQIKGVAEPIGRAAHDIRASSDTTADTLAKTREFTAHVVISVRQLKDQLRLIAEAWNKYQDRFENVDRALNKVFTEIEGGLQRYCEQVTEFARELDKTTGSTVGHLSAATSELSNTIGDLIDGLQKAKP